MATAAQPIGSDVSTLSNEAQAEHIMRQAMLWSFGAGFIPAPTLDVIAVSGIQLNMLHEMGRIYGMPLRDEWGKAIIGSLLGGMSARWVADSFIGSGLKMIPIAGHLLSYAMLPTASAASTYAVAKVFIQHFESGGTFLDFDPTKVRKYFSQQYAEGKRVVSETFGRKDKEPK